MNVPGFDQPLREQTLAEFVLVLDESHLVRRELKELQRRASQAAVLSAKVTELEQTLRETEAVANQLRAQDAAPPNIVQSAVYKKVNCPLCSKPISTFPGPWYNHMKRMHAVSGADAPEPPK